MGCSSPAFLDCACVHGLVTGWNFLSNVVQRIRTLTVKIIKGGSMLKRSISLFILVCILCSSGCHFTKEIVMRKDLDPNKYKKYVFVCTADSTYVFGQLSPGVIVDDTLISGKIKSGNYVSIPLRDVKMACLLKTNLLIGGYICLSGICAGFFVFTVVFFLAGGGVGFHH